MNYLRQIGEQLKELWASLSVAGRVAVCALSAFCLAAIVAVAYWAATPDFRVLARDVSLEDANAITAKLESSNIPYRLADGGATIMVRSRDFEKASLQVASAGLLSGGVEGWSVFDNAHWMTDPSTGRVNYVRALQGELAKTIMRFDPVTAARVHIVIPDPTPFVREQKPATASVVLKLKPGARLAPDRAAAIAALVAGAVEGLDPERVTLVDTLGRILYTPDDPISNTAATQLEYQREVEAYLASKAEGMLAQLLGPGRAVVQVTADVDFKKVKETKETYDPEDKVITSEKVVTVKQTGTSALPRGVAGTGSNLGRGLARGTEKGTNSQEETIESEYQVSKTVQEVEQRAGTIQRLTVAAMVDLPESGAQPGGTSAPGITAEEVEKIIRQAVGFEESRGDQIQVSVAKLASSAAHDQLEAAWADSEQWQRYLLLARQVSLGMASLVALVLGFLVLRRLPALAGSPEVGQRAGLGQLADRLAAEARQNPEAMARALSAWLEQPASQGPEHKQAA